MARAKKRHTDPLRRALRERDGALAFQAATDEILTAISRSTSDAKPVFDAIVRSVPRLFGTRYVAVFLVKGDELHLAASKADVEYERRHAAVFRRFRDSFPQPIDWKGFTGRALRSGKVSQIAPIIGNPKATPQAVQLAEEFGYNAMLVAPLVRDGKTIGAIGTTRPEAKLFDARELALFKRFAAQAVIAIENARLFNETKEALEQQTATSQILGVISSSPTDLAPVFDAILASAMQLCEAHLGIFNLYDGEWLRTVAQRGGNPQFAKWLLERGSIKPDGGMTYQAITERRAVQIADVREAPGYREGKPNISKFVDLGAVRTFLAVPLLREGAVIGTIGIYRPEVRTFTDKQIALVSTFANQAVIAIENARLFNETKEALERQTATAEILKVISSSPTATQPVFESIVQKCHALYQDSRVALLLIDDGRLITRASTGYVFEPVPIDRESGLGACVLEGRTIHLPDLEAAAEQYPRLRQLGIKHGYRSGMYAPLMREGRAVGGISVLRRAAGAFSEKDVALLTTFADQAVIAIENARLFNETKEALEQQTATAGVLRVIAASPTDLTPVMNAVVERAARLLEADHALIGQSDGENIHWLAACGCPVPDGARSITRVLPSGRAILDLQTTQIEDIGQIERDALIERSYSRFGVRTICATPLIREGRAVGVILLRRTQVRPFTEKQMSLLRTFADQAAIAIENVRLFNETTEALEQQTASNEILRVISSSPSDLRPVFNAMLESATRLCDAHLGVLNLFEDEMCRTVAQRGGSPEFAKWVLERDAFKPAAAMARILAERKPFHVPDAREGPGFKARNENAMKFVELGGVRTYLAVPLLKEGAVIGSINIFRPDVRPFTDKQIAVVSTFADQAVIAIENVRLFNELQSTNATLREALEQQTATGEILKVIASATTEVQPVFHTIVRNAARLGNAAVGFLISYDGATMRLAAQYNVGPEEEAIYRPAFPRPAARDTMTGRAILDRTVINLADVQNSDFGEGTKGRAHRAGYRSALVVPMLRDGVPIGSLNIQRREAGAFPDSYVALLKTFADQAVIAIENVRLFNETKEALERQTATAEILRVISGTPTDTQPVFDAIVSSAQRLLSGKSAGLILRRESEFFVAAHSIFTNDTLPEELRRVPLDREKNFPSRVILDGEVVHIPDWHATDVPEHERVVARTVGFGSGVQVPLLREGQSIGALMVSREAKGHFHEKEIALLRSFADQAVIAMENVRLFNETKEALERQTATAEILRVISASPSDVQPVFDAVAENAARVCGVDDVAILRVEDGGLRRVAHIGTVPVLPDPCLPLLPGGVNERVLAERRTVHIPDTAAPSFAAEFPGSQHAEMGVRSLLVTPLVHDGRVVGLIQLRRVEPRPFTDKQIALLETFADQAVIAIENVRLFNETKEALERQTATGEILASMSGSMTDTKPVFDAIVSNLLRLFGSSYAVVSLRRGQVFELGGFKGEPGFERLEDLYPFPVDEHTIVGEVVMARQVSTYTPMAGNPAVPRRTAEFAQGFGFDSIMAAPMMWKGEAIGAIVTARRQPLPFDDKQLALIQSFADQAVIAIENVRLFKELQERTEALTRSVGQLTALGDVGRAISSTLELDEVLRTIVQRAVQLAGLDGGSIYEFDESDGRFHLRAAQNVAEDVLAVYRSSPIRLGEGAVGRAGATREPVAVEDVRDDSYRSRAREMLIKSGARALLAVPLLREQLLLGALVVSRKSPGPFAPEVVDLLKTFATQSAVAIQNARLFRELAQKSRELEDASRHKSQFLASMSHELRTPLNAILGFNEMILGQVYGEVPSDMQEPLEDIQKSGRHLLRLINNVLDLAKIEAGKMELALADYSVQDTVESVRSTLRPLAEAKGLELVVRVPEDIPLAYGDGGRLTQCLMNLAGNSLKFTKEGRVEIAVEAENGCLRWRVSDTGIGIPPDKIPTLFSEFKQTDATIASEYGGTGLGLSITKKFVEMHGGRIWVESEPGKGSVFTVEVPLRVTGPA